VQVLAKERENTKQEKLPPGSMQKGPRDTSSLPRLTDSLKVSVELFVKAHCRLDVEK